MGVKFSHVHLVLGFELDIHSTGSPETTLDNDFCDIQGIFFSCCHANIVHAL